MGAESWHLRLMAGANREKQPSSVIANAPTCYLADPLVRAADSGPMPVESWFKEVDKTRKEHYAPLSVAER